MWSPKPIGWCHGGCVHLLNTDFYIESLWSAFHFPTSFRLKWNQFHHLKKNKTMFLLADWKSTDGVSSTLLLTSVTCGSDLNWDVCYNQSLKFYFECLDDAQVFCFFFHLKILKKKWPNKSAGILQKGFLIIVSVGSYTSPFGSRSWTHPPKTHHDGITQYSISHRDCNWKEESSWYTLSCLDKFPSCLAKQNNPLRDDTV